MLENICGSIVRYTLGIALTLVAIVVPAISFAASLPATRDAIVLPGESKDVEIPIVNSGAVDVEYSLLLLSASFQRGMEQPQLEQLSSDIASWISLSSSFVHVPSGMSGSSTLSVHPPRDAAPRAFTVAVVATEKIVGEISLIHGAATLVFISVGDVSAHGICESFLQDTPDSAHLSLTNDGRGILYDNGEITLRGMFGIRLGSSPSNPLFHRVPSGQTRTWQVSLPTIPWWAVGPLSYTVDDTQLRERPCSDIGAGVRWLPLLVVGIGVCCVGLFIRRRIS